MARDRSRQELEPRAPVEPASVPQPMSLEQAHAALRAEIQAHRAKLVLYDAVETALTAKQTLKGLEIQQAGLKASITTTQADKVTAEKELGEARTALAVEREKLSAAQTDLKALNTSIADTKQAWITEQRMQETSRRTALADLDRETLAAKERLAAVQKELAGVVSKYAPASVSV